MPNWCQNTLTVNGDERAVDRFITANSDPEGNKETRVLTFERALPTPEPLLAPNQGGWYDWRVSHWGTKWDASIFDGWERHTSPTGDATATLRFDTAWTPPVAWLESVGAVNSDLLLRLDYTEHGSCYTGYAVAEDGYFADHEQVYEGPTTDEDAYF